MPRDGHTRSPFSCAEDRPVIKQEGGNFWELFAARLIASSEITKSGHFLLTEQKENKKTHVNLELPKLHRSTSPIRAALATCDRDQGKGREPTPKPKPKPKSGPEENKIYARVGAREERDEREEREEREERKEREEREEREDARLMILKNEIKILEAELRGARRAEARALAACLALAQIANRPGGK